MMLRSLEAFIGQSGLRGRCLRKRTKVVGVVGRDYKQVSHAMIFATNVTSGSTWWHLVFFDQIINDSSIDYIEIVNAEAFFSMFDHLWNCNKSNISFIVAVNFCFNSNVNTWPFVYFQGGNQILLFLVVSNLFNQAFNQARLFWGDLGVVHVRCNDFNVFYSFFLCFVENC